MKSKLLPNGLSRRTTRCLLNAGIPIDKQTIRSALQTGKLYPFHWPPNYGKYTHREVCRWARVNPDTLPPRPLEVDLTPFPDIGLSYRAWQCLCRSGITATKEAVRHALQTGVLLPRKRPSNYGPITHAELCRWTGLDPASLRSKTAKFPKSNSRTTDTMKRRQPSPKQDWKDTILSGPDWPEDLTIPQNDQLPEGSESILESMYCNEHWEWELWREPEGHCYYLKVWPFNDKRFGKPNTPGVALTVQETFQFLMTNWMPRDVLIDLAMERPSLLPLLGISPHSPRLN